jgi:putative tryptophan/tyrosine transport system substrate-binding protein
MSHRWSRRELVQGASVAGLGLLAGCGRLPWQVPSQAQRSAKVPTIVYIGSARGAGRFEELFVQGLRDLGYAEGKNIIVEYRYTGGDDARFPDLAAEVVRLPADVIVTMGTPATQAAKAATSTTPIVMVVVGDPVLNRLVDSFSRPGGNVTGLTNDVSSQLLGKRLELLTQTLPGLARVGTVATVGSYAAEPTVRDTRDAAHALGVELLVLEVQRPDEIPGAFEAAAGQGAQALLQLPVPLGSLAPQGIVASVEKSRLPAMYISRGYVEVGGLMSYGPSVLDSGRRVATYVDKILKGAKPADLPVEQPMRFDFAINMNTAQALGLTIPQHVLLQATEVIQ